MSVSFDYPQDHHQATRNNPSVVGHSVESTPFDWTGGRRGTRTRSQVSTQPGSVTQLRPAPVAPVQDTTSAAADAVDLDGEDSASLLAGQVEPTIPPMDIAAGQAPSVPAGQDPDRSARVAALLVEMVNCDNPVERKRLQAAVVVEHLSVAKSIASRYRGRGVERGDLEQLAYLGLVKAASRWLPGLSDDFLQFAVPTISGEIKRYFRDHSWLVRPPRRIQELRAAISVAERDFQDSGEHRPSDTLVGNRLGVRDTDIREARAAAGLCRPPSLDSDSGAGLFIAQQWSGDDCMSVVDDRMSLEVVLRTLTERERKVVAMRFNEGLSQARIGELIGVSQMQVSRILRDVVTKLRDRWDQ